MGEERLAKVDARYAAFRHGDMTFTMPTYPSLADWQERATWLREHIQVTLDLWPMPERQPLQARISNCRAYPDYCLSKVCFESWPGFYCTGNLYRPRDISGPVPAIVNPHGHWEHGRLEHAERGSIRARCITLARMGMVAFSYDMVGYNDSIQVPTHGFATLRGSLWGLSPLALQTWNSVQAVDFVASLPNVDQERIGCTGASGGGTQTFMLTAIDDRIKVSAPVNMISAHMQGGCNCENAPGLRVDTNNMEIGALMAPRPMLMVSATGDWTVNTPTVEYPAIRSIYQLYDADDHLAWAQVDAEHNYNAESRDHVYRWFAKWFLGDESLGAGAERPIDVEPDERLRVFPGGILPAGAISGPQVEQAWRAQRKARLKDHLPHHAESLMRTRAITRTRWEHMLGAKAPNANVIAPKLVATADKGWGQAQELILGRVGQGDRIPATLYRPTSEPIGACLLCHEAGRQGWLDGLDEPLEAIAQLVQAGYLIMTIDPFAIGTLPRERQLPNDHDWFEATFNPPTLGRQVQDYMTSLAYLNQQAAPVAIAAWGRASAGAILAAAQSPAAKQLAVDLSGIALDADETYLGDWFLPNLRTWGDLRLPLTTWTPKPLWLAGQAQPPAWVQNAYRCANASSNLVTTLMGLDIAGLQTWLRDESA